MGTTLLLSSAFSPLSHRPRHGNERTHLQPQTLPPQFAISFLFQLPPEVSAGPPHSPWALTRRARPLRVGSVGEDSAAFELGEQKISSWMYFSVVLGVVLFLLDLAWIDNSTGLGKAFIEAVSELSDRRQPRVFFGWVWPEMKIFVGDSRLGLRLDPRLLDPRLVAAPILDPRLVAAPIAAAEEEEEAEHGDQGHGLERRDQTTDRARSDDRPQSRSTRNRRPAERDPARPRHGSIVLESRGILGF